MITGLALPYILGIDVISFSISMSLFLFFCLIFLQKKKGEDAEFYFFLLIGFQILHVF
jgi:hypothetical protein